MWALSRFARVSHSANLVTRYQQTKAALAGDLAPILSNARLFPEKVAIQDAEGKHTYAELLRSAHHLSGGILRKLNGRLNERVMFLCPNNVDYVVTLWAIWMAGQIAVPVSPLHPKNLLLYYANDSSSNLLVTTEQYSELMQWIARNTNAKLHVLEPRTPSTALEAPLPSCPFDTTDALIIYTSGTTGSPKGVVLTHHNLVYQVNTLLDAWRWSPNDVLLHTLPLHHIHGIVNALLCPLYIGAKTLMLPKFDAKSVWSHLIGVNQPGDRRVTVYMAVPTIYSKLIDEYERVFSADPKMVEYVRNTLASKMRLMVSGSAPLQSQVYQKWLEITGHKLLERYGMTEIGMCLSNLYDSDRPPGHVGLPLPGVSVQLEDETGQIALKCTNRDKAIEFKSNDCVIKDGKVTGELLVKSGGVFKEYFNRSEATKKEFTSDGWFRTGDICEYYADKKQFKIAGRKSADIIKSRGYKISAVQVESELLEHPSLKECSVVGVEDPKWGQRVAAVVVLKKGAELSLKGLREWSSDRLPSYSTPSELMVVEEIPKNAMGKVNKKELIEQLFKKGNTPTQIKDQLGSVYGDSVPLFTTVKLWAAEFKRGRKSLGDDERSKTADDIAKVHEMVLDD